MAFVGILGAGLSGVVMGIQPDGCCTSRRFATFFPK